MTALSNPKRKPPRAAVPARRVTYGARTLIGRLARSRESTSADAGRHSQPGASLAALATTDAEEGGGMQRWFGFLFMLALVAAVLGFGRFAGVAVSTVMRVVLLVSLVLMLASGLFGRRRATS